MYLLLFLFVFVSLERIARAQEKTQDLLILVNFLNLFGLATVAPLMINLKLWKNVLANY
jgi:hypothetical protein